MMINDVGPDSGDNGRNDAKDGNMENRVDLNNSSDGKSASISHTETGIANLDRNISIDSEGLEELCDIPTDEEDSLLKSDEEACEEASALSVGPNISPRTVSMTVSANEHIEVASKNQGGVPYDRFVRILRPQTVSKSDTYGIQQSKRPSKPGGVPYDRLVRISRPKTASKSDICTIRQSKRPSKPIQHYNYGIVACFICKRKFTGDIPVALYVGGIACSLECLRRSNQC